MQLEGRVVVVTGASSGIGAATVRQLAARGARVAGVARRQEALNSVANQAREAGGEVMVHCADVGIREEASASVQAVVQAYGRLDALINNAAVALAGSIADLDPDDVAYLFRTNVLGAVNMTHAALPWLRRQEEAVIINVSSPVGKLVIPYLSTYGASKAALDVLTRALRAEFDQTNVKVLEFNPGMTRTGLFAPAIGEDHPFVSVVARHGDDPDGVAKRLADQLAAGGPSVVYARRQSRWQTLAGRLLGPAWLARRMERWAAKHGFTDLLISKRDNQAVPPGPGDDR